MKTGDILLGTFEIVEVIQERPHARVYRARDVRLHRDLCVKILPPGEAHSSAPTADRYREARLASSLRSPHTLQVYYCNDLPGAGVLFVTEWADRGSLRDILRARGRLPLLEALDIVRQVALSLAEAHALGIVHRDVKPENTLLCSAGRRVVAKLADFGIAATTAELAGPQRHIAGTPPYMAPEVWTGAPVDPRADIYALAVMAWELVAGRWPFEGPALPDFRKQHLEAPPPPLAAVVPGVPAEVSEALSAAMAKEPALRPPTVEAFAASMGVPIEPQAAAVGSSDATEPVPRPSAEATTALASATTVAGRGAGPTVREGVLRTRVPVTFVLGGGDASALDAWQQRFAAAAVALRKETHRRLVALGLHSGDPDAPTTALRIAATVTEPVATAIHATTVQARPGAPAPDILDERDVEAAVRVLEALLEGSPPGAVVVSPPTWEQVAAQYRAVLAARIDALRHRGAAALVAALAEPPAWKPRELPTATPRFVGRGSEVEALATLVEEAIEEGRCAWGHVEGPAGSGKSRVWYEAYRQVRNDLGDVRCVTVTATPDLAAVPGGLVARLLRKLFALPAGCDTRKAEEHVARKLASWGEPAPRALAHDLAEFVDAGRGGTRTPPDGASVQRLRRRGELEAMVARVLRAAATDASLILVVEDAHWMDANSLEVVCSAARSARDVPLAVVSIARPRLRPALERRLDGLLSVIEVGPMPAPLARRLARSLLARVEREAAGRLGARLVELSQGVPLFAEEIVRLWIQQGILAPSEDGTWRLTREPTGASVPATIERLVLARLEPLAPAARLVVHAAAVVGPAFGREELGVLLREDVPGVIDKALEELEAHDIIHRVASTGEARETWRFAHALLRDAAYAAILEQDRRHWHQRLGAWFDGLCQTDASYEVASLAVQHWERAGNPRRLLDAHERAGDIALTRSAVGDAQAHYERALELAGAVRAAALRRVALWIKLGRAREGAHRHDEALEAWNQAEAILRRATGTRHGRSAQARYWQATVHYARALVAARRGRLDEALDLCGKARNVLTGGARRRRLRPADRILLARIANWSGWVHRSRGEPDKAAGALREGLDALAPLPEQDALRERSTLRSALAVVLGELGAPQGEVRRQHEAAIADKEALVERNGELRPLGTACINYAHWLIERGDADEAARWLRRAEEVASTMQYPEMKAVIEGNWARLLALGGDVGSARRHLEAARALARRHELGWLDEALDDIERELARADTAPGPTRQSSSEGARVAGTQRKK